MIADPFAEDTEKAKKGGDTRDYVHVRVQQRNGRKSLTTVQGLPTAFDYKKILKALKKGECLLASPPFFRSFPSTTVLNAWFSFAIPSLPLPSRRVLLQRVRR